MKKILMTLVAVAMATTMNAQYFVGGTVGYSHASNENSHTNTWTVAPEFGYSLNDQWTIATSIGYVTSKTDNEKTSGFFIAPYARYTFAKLEKINFFVDLGFGYEHGRETSKSFWGGEVDKDYNNWEIGLYPGLAVNLNSKISFVTKIGVLNYTTSHVCGSDVTDKGFNLGIDNSDLSFSVYYNF